jgi:hypothetical protein
MAYRVIFCLYVWLVGPQPGLGPALMRWLRPDGQLHKNGKNNNGKSRTGKRAIDLRVGDEIMCGGKWMTIERIIAYRSATNASTFIMTIWPTPSGRRITPPLGNSISTGGDFSETGRNVTWPDSIC